MSSGRPNEVKLNRISDDDRDCIGTEYKNNPHIKHLICCSSNSIIICLRSFEHRQCRSSIRRWHSRLPLLRWLPKLRRIPVHYRLRIPLQRRSLLWLRRLHLLSPSIITIITIATPTRRVPTVPQFECYFQGSTCGQRIRRCKKRTSYVEFQYRSTHR